MNWTRLLRTLLAGSAIIAAAAPLGAQTRYVLVSNLTRQVLSVDGPSPTPTETVYQAEYTAGRNQQWTVSRPAYDGTVQIRNVATGRVLEYAEEASSPTVKARRAVSGRLEQVWRIESEGDDAATILSEYSGLELTVYPWLAGDVAPVILAHSWGSAMYSRWLLVPAYSTPTPGALQWSFTGAGEVSATGTRNAIRVAFKMWPQPNGQGTAIWREALYDWISNRWVCSGPITTGQTDPSQSWPVEAYALGVDNTWHLIGLTTVIPPPPPDGKQPEMKGK